eukprot:294007-Pelagomonas_calceolata.AAC.3
MPPSIVDSTAAAVCAACIAGPLLGAAEAGCAGGGACCVCCCRVLLAAAHSASNGACPEAKASTASVTHTEQMASALLCIIPLIKRVYENA